MKIKREKSIKIRVTNDELEKLKLNNPTAQLAKWMRETCLDERPAQKTPPIKVDPQLLRQLTGVGNNLNQIARRVNSPEFGAVNISEVITKLFDIERQVTAIRESHDC